MNDQKCPLCKGDAQQEAVKDEPYFVHVTCGGACRGEYLIGHTTIDQIGQGDAQSRASADLASCNVPDGQIRLVAWRAEFAFAEVVLMDRDAWFD